MPSLQAQRKWPAKKKIWYGTRPAISLSLLSAANKHFFLLQNFWTGASFPHLPIMMSVQRVQIVVDGLEAKHVYRVEKGRVRVEKGDRLTPVGQGAVVNQIQEGQTFGEMSFLDDSTACANCIADADEVLLCRVSKRAGGEATGQPEGSARLFQAHGHRGHPAPLDCIRGLGGNPRGASRCSAAGGPGQRQRQGALACEAAQGASPLQHRRLRPDGLHDEGNVRQGQEPVRYDLRLRDDHRLHSQSLRVKQQEAFPFRDISEVLRETFTLKLKTAGSNCR